MEKVFLIPDESKVDSQKSPKVAPFIDYLVDYLFNKYRKNDFWDMSNVLLVVPSARVRLETLEQILIRAEKERVLWEIPKIVTIGRAPEYFYQQTRPFADDVTQFLAWGKAVESSDKNKRAKFFPVIPDKDDLTKRILFGQMLGALHENLAAESLSFADVAKKLKDPSFNFGKLNLQNEIDRWNFLSEVEEKYLSSLDKLNLWDRQAARRYALDTNLDGDFETDLDIILAGIVDLNKIQKDMLQRVDEKLQSDKKHVTALIYASKSESEGFDQFGALKVEYWSADLRCPLSEDKIIQVDKPEEQVLCAFDFIRQMSKDFSPDDFVIGAPDEQLIPFIESEADKLGLEIDNTIGISLSSTVPGALLTAIAEFLEMHDFESFANLVRHPEVYDAIYNASDKDGKIIPDKSIEIISILDSFQLNNLPLDVSSGFLANPFNEEQGIIKRVLIWINEWLSELNQKEIDPKKLKQIVTNIFACLPKDKYVLNRNAQRMLINIAGKLELIPKSLTGKLTPVSALKLLLLRSKTYTLPNGSEEDNEEDESQESDASAASKPLIHLAGWLELVWDRSPVLAILSFNEGVVPQSVNAHLFLPNELRKALGIMHNDRRFARDAYALKAMSFSKQHIRAIFGKRDTEGKPTLPSRLLFNKGEDKDKMATFAAQAFRFFNEKQPLPKFFMEEPGFQESKSLNDYIEWAKDNLSGGALKGVVSEVSATKLRDYIQCPFRFYLKHVLKVQPTDYAVSELTSLSFGTFVHQVLQEWAQKELNKGRTDWRIPADELSEVLSDIVDKVFKRFYPNSVLPGIVIQKEIIKQRLKSFADFQSTWDGEIIAVEHPFEQVVKVGRSKNDMITLKGKIDRIDRKPDGTIILLDYKTGKTDPYDDHIDKNKIQDPDNKHFNWVNLQLPVYRQIILANREEFDWMTPDAAVQVGYITIPYDEKASLKNPCEQPGSRSKKVVWNDNVFSDAEKYTTEILTNIYNGVFWPPTPTKDLKFDDYPDFVSWLERNEDDWE